MPSVNERQALLLPRARDGACHAHHSLPLYRRPLGNLLKVQASVLGMASGSVAVLVGLLILATFLALFNYLTPSGKLTVTGRRAGGDAECVGSDLRHSRQTQRAGQSRRRAVSDRSCTIPVQGISLEQDPEKWGRYSLATNAERVCAEITLKQKSEMTIRRKVITLYWLGPLAAASACSILFAISALTASRLKLAPLCIGG